MDYPSNNPNIRPLPGAGPAPDVPGIFSPASPGSWIYDFDPFTQKARATFNGLVDVSLTPPVLPNIPPGTVLGNESGAEGPPTALTQAQLATLIGTFATVQPGLVPDAPGASPFLQVLNGDGNWVPLQGEAQSTNSTLTVNPSTGYIDTSTVFSTITITLAPSSSVFTGARLTIVIPMATATNTVTITTAGGDTLRDPTNASRSPLVITAPKIIELTSNGNNTWYVGTLGVP